MNKRIIMFVVGLLIASTSFVNAQEESSSVDWGKWKLGLYPSMLQYHSENGTQFFKPKESTGAVSIGLGRVLNSSFDAELALMGGNIKFTPEAGDSGSTALETKVFDLTGNIYYKFANGYILKEEARVAPFLYAGAGAMRTENGFDFVAPLGAGINFRVDEMLNFQVRSAYKWNTDQNYDLFQHSIGMVIQLGSNGEKIADRDKDGIPDDQDACPDEKGEASLAGCPDSDGDGIADKDDSCPFVAGVESNRGCPEVDEETKTVLNEALRGIQFETSKDVIKSESYPILDNVVSLMKKHPEYKLSIEGHTDSSGDEAMNLDLSKRRAKAAMNYLIDKGISADRLRSEGFGETRPVADNSTSEGRAQNRRVEFNIEF